MFRRIFSSIFPPPHPHPNSFSSFTIKGNPQCVCVCVCVCVCKHRVWASIFSFAFLLCEKSLFRPSLRHAHVVDTLFFAFPRARVRAPHHSPPTGALHTPPTKHFLPPLALCAPTHTHQCTPARRCMRQAPGAKCRARPPRRPPPPRPPAPASTLTVSPLVAAPPSSRQVPPPPPPHHPRAAAATARQPSESVRPAWRAPSASPPPTSGPRRRPTGCGWTRTPSRGSGRSWRLLNWSPRPRGPTRARRPPGRPLWRAHVRPRRGTPPWRARQRRLKQRGRPSLCRRRGERWTGGRTSAHTLTPPPPSGGAWSCPRRRAEGREPRPRWPSGCRGRRSGWGRWKVS